jgi:hypothetical protein
VNRNDWEFEYTASKLAEGARAQLAFRRGRIEAWTKAKREVMAEIKESGIEVSESMGAGFSNYTEKMGPQVMVRGDLQRKLTECHAKIREHEKEADEIGGWIQVLEANPEARLKLNHSDWIYFFGKRWSPDPLAESARRLGDFLDSNSEQ